ncbi:ulk3, partial [Symbiodinium pilosum]
MEGARGGDLDRALRRAKKEGQSGLAEKTVRLLMEQALRALVYIHSECVIHRDVKPSNMILTRLDQHPPHLLLADFGIAD